MISHPKRSKAARAAKAKSKTAPIASSIRAARPLVHHDHDADYAALLGAVTISFERAIADGAPLFTTSAEGLFDLYIKNLPAERDVHTCGSCRRFIESYGGLVTISPDGSQMPVMWQAGAPDFYLHAVSAIRAAVGRARVTGIFLSSDAAWGNAVTGAWTHFAVRQPSARIYRESLLTPGQKMAERRDDFRTVAAALSDFSPMVLSEAMRLLETDSLANSEKFIGSVQWLQDLHTGRTAAKDARIRDNILWRAIATAPSGYCHPRASVVGSLIEDIAAGMDFTTVKGRFDAKMHPLQYQRPQAAPTAGALAAAEKAVEKLGIGPSLERRFARLDDCEPVWIPAPVKGEASRSGGVFSHLTPKNGTDVKALNIPAQVMTWEKFARVVLPEAEAMKIRLPSHGNYMAYLTATHADAPPILKWDRLERRNPVSRYVYHNGSVAHQWGLSGDWGTLTAVVPSPAMWGDHPQPHLGDGVLFVIKGCVDSRDDQGNALFPVTLRDDLHGVRSVIEAYSKRAKITGREEASACGLGLAKGSDAGFLLRVTSRGAETDYKIDRWD